MKKQHNSSKQEGKPRGNHALGCILPYGRNGVSPLIFSLDCTHTTFYISFAFDKFSSTTEVIQVNSLTTLISYPAISVTDSMVLESWN